MIVAREKIVNNDHHHRALFNSGFYHNKPLVFIHDIRTKSHRVIDKIVAIFSYSIEILGRVKYFFQFFKHRKVLFLNPVKHENRWIYQKSDLPWTHHTESDGLFLFVHGLWGSPLCWGGYLADLIKTKAHIVAPRVAERGNCALERSAEPFIHLVKDYMLKFPGKKVTLIGTSNGGRILSEIETKLNKEEIGNRALDVISIAGVHWGTHVPERLAKWKILPRPIVGKVLEEEFRFGGHYAQSLMERWRNKQLEWAQHNVRVRHLFCATLEDHLVVNVSSALPILPHTPCYYKIDRNHSHVSLPYGVKDHVLNWVNGAA